jgi:hypothetical protein
MPSRPAVKIALRVPEREFLPTQQFIFNNIQVIHSLSGVFRTPIFDSRRAFSGLKLLETKGNHPLSKHDSGLTADDSGCGGVL